MKDMNDAQIVARNSLFQAISNIGDKVLSFIIIILLARYLGAANFGIYAFAMAFVSFFSIAIDLGLGPLLGREIAKDKTKADTYFGGNLIIKTITSTLSFILIALLINLTKDAQVTIYAVYFAAAIMISFSFCQSFHGLFVTFEKAQYNAVFLTLTKALQLSGVTVAIFLKMGLLNLMLILCFTNLLSLVFSSSFVLKKFIHIKFNINFNLWKNLIKQALPFALMDVFILIYFNIDRVMLSYMVNDTAVGLYTAAYTLALAFLFISVSVSTASYPTISRLYRKNNELVLKIYRTLFKYLLAIGIAMAVGTALLASQIVGLVFGQGYLESIPVLKIVVLICPIMFITNLMGRVLGAIHMERPLVWLTGLGAFANVIMNLMLIPIIGIMGAAIATVITEIFIFIGLYHLLTNSLGSIIFHKIVPQIIIANMIMGFVIFFIQNIHILFVVCIAALAYFGTLYLLKFSSKEEIQFLKEMLFSMSS